MRWPAEAPCSAVKIKTSRKKITKIHCPSPRKLWKIKAATAQLISQSKTMAENLRAIEALSFIGTPYPPFSIFAGSQHPEDET
jgi:hypothetical protein